MSYKRIETDNPILDEIVYNCKKIIVSLIIKDENKANKLETQESLFNFDTYNAIRNGTIDLFYFTITTEDLTTLFPYYNSKTLNQWLQNVHSMPPDLYLELLNYKINCFLETYEEMNEYYRLISGQAPLDGSQDIYLNKNDIEELSITIDMKKPIHKYSQLEKQAIINSELLDNLKSKYPNYDYLNYYDKEIDPYNARLAPNYDILYLDNSCNETIITKYLELYSVNRKYIYATMSYDAIRYYSPLYERFMMMNIALSAMTDMITSFNEFFINREIFDMRTAQYFFESYGVDFYEEIPLKYQKKMIRALNKLIKYKSTDKNIYDIAQIFGFKNIEIYKYYLQKKHKQYFDANDEGYTDKDGNIIHYGKYSTAKSLSDRYELQFIKVPFKEMVNDYLKDDNAILDYESVTNGDEYWYGDQDPKEVTNTILETDFNIIQTKYISINTVYMITNASFQISYFMNMLLYYGLNPKNMKVTIPGIDSKNDQYNLMEAVVFIYAASCIYMGINVYDEANKIITDPEQMRGINGFDIYADITQLSSDILTEMEMYIEAEAVRSNMTLKEFIDSVANNTYENQIYGEYSTEYINIIVNVIRKFKTFNKNQCPTIQQLVYAYKNNKEVYDYITYKMTNASDIEIYKIYRKLYNTLMIININNKLFQISDDGTVASTYMEWLATYNPRMFNKLDDIIKLSTESEETMREELYAIISNACASVTAAISDESLSDVLMDIPTETSDNLKQWMTKVMKFFMSYKLQILDTQSVNKLDLEVNRLKDGLTFNSMYEFTDYMNATDSSSITGTLNLKPDKMRPRDLVEVIEYYEEVEDE